ncbi:hypothetical protein ACIRRH_34615 [Kitasatospora sp. NPDC101235]|uniref:hypothetical protein n=1 Tax=Kitasatospora sp. NPDC101235 TaxID=3364101 RepID=UPI003825FF6E
MVDLSGYCRPNDGRRFTPKCAEQTSFPESIRVLESVRTGVSIGRPWLKTAKGLSYQLMPSW